MRSLQKFYNSYRGVDSRTNQLLQNPESARGGSINFRWNFQDELIKSNGFQHKTDSNTSVTQGTVEYKYKDVNTGEQKSKILGVSAAGDLYLKKADYLDFTVSIPANYIVYSFYYDEVALTYKFVYGANTINVSDTMTMDQLVAALNAVAVGVTFKVVDESGATISSSKLAYYGDVVINETVYVGDKFHSSWYWSKIDAPDSTATLFPTTYAYKDNKNYEYLSSVNLNNSIYITDGGFPIKFDGFAAYRAGMPRTAEGNGVANGSGVIERYDGFKLEKTTVGSLTTGSDYRYVFQFGFKDANGVEILGKTIDPMIINLSGGANAVNITIPYLKYDLGDFPIWTCKVNIPLGQVIDTTSGQVITVDSGHNIKVGMHLRIPVKATGGAPFLGWSYWIAKVTAVTSTTITVQNPPQNNLRNPDNTSYTVIDNQVINGGYTQDYNSNKITDSLVGSAYPTSDPVLGAFVRIYRSTANTTAISWLFDQPLPRLSDGVIVYKDTLSDTGVGGLSAIAYDQNVGSDLPRACKYLTKHQGFLFQAGRPVNGDLKYVNYPSAFDVSDTFFANNNIKKDLSTLYTEAHLCDFSSVYWNDVQAIEGFPQDGLHEFLIETNLNDRITAIAPNKDVLACFKEDSTSILTGDVAQNNLSYEIIEQVVGCSSHRSVQDVQGTLIWVDKDYGFYSMVAGRLPVFIGFDISDNFRLKKVNAFNAVACNYLKEALYICAIGSKIFVYDYANTSEGQSYRNAWYLWDRFTPVDLMCDSNDKVYMNDGSRIWKMKTTNTKYDNSDHKSGYPFIFITSWFTNAKPTIDKDFFGVWINSINGGFNLDVDQYFNFIDSVQATYEGLSFQAYSTSKVAIKEYVNMNAIKVSSLSLGFKNSDINSDVKINGWELEFSDSYDASEPRR